MNDLKIGDTLVIHCYKHNGLVYESSKVAYVLDIKDLRVFSDGAFKVLDRNEYNYHKKLMKYPEEINYIVKEELSNLIEMKKASEFPFKKETIEYYYDEFKKIKEKK